MVALFNFVTLVRFVVLKSLLKLYISDEPLPENLRKPGILSRIAIHAFSQTALGKRSSPVGEQLVLIISAHDNFRRLVDLLGG